MATNTWRRLLPDHTLRILTPETFEDFLSMPPPRNFYHINSTTAIRADWIRLALLSEHGGVWMDPGSVFTRNLNTGLQDQEAFVIWSDMADAEMPQPLVLGSVTGGKWVTAWLNELNLFFNNFACNDQHYFYYLRSVLGRTSFDRIAHIPPTPMVKGNKKSASIASRIAARKALVFDFVPPPRASTLSFNSGPLSGCRDGLECAKRLLEPVQRPVTTYTWSCCGRKREIKAFALPPAFKLSGQTLRALEDLLRDEEPGAGNLDSSLWGRLVAS
ncbi:hypothetical protein HDU67_006377 [Dinochytrium kinnereticum]|nr:hypothetical protein HDU67_006377 [Dinochytrium kinnereticum]